jgi:hypothetical protein
MQRRALFSALLVTSALGAQARPSTDIWLVPLAQNGSTVKVGEPRNLTHRTGYDNQPSFTPRGDAILYTAVGADAQADIWRIALPNGAPRNMTNTPESEYSATVTPDGRSYSVIRVEADSTQRLWRFPLDGNGPPSLVLEKIKPVGYHLWAGDHTLVLYVLGVGRAPATLQVADDRTGTAEVVGSNIGRALGKVPGRDAVTFQQLVRDSSSWISELDLRTKQTRRLFVPPPGADYHAWTPGGALLAAAGSNVYVRTDRGWDVAADLAPWGVKNITRLAVSPRGDWLAFVAEDRPVP